MRCKLGEDRKPQYCSDAHWPYQYPSVPELDPFTVSECVRSRVTRGPGSVTHQGSWLCSRATTAKGSGAALQPQHRPGSRHIHLDSTPWDQRLWTPLGAQRTCCSTQDSKAAFITTAERQALAGVALPKPFHAASWTPCCSLHTAAMVSSPSHPSCRPCLWRLHQQATYWGLPVKELKASSDPSPKVWPHQMNELIRQCVYF